MTPQETAELTRVSGHPDVSREELKKWYGLMHLSRVLDDKAPNYLKQGLGWSYHAPCAGHDAIQLALGMTFRPNRDYLFPYYRDLATCVAAGLTAEEILLNGMSKATDVASGGRSRVSAQTNLTTLPATWSSGTLFSSAPMSAYARP